MSSSINRKLKVTGLYFFSGFMLFTYWYITNSTELETFLKQADHSGPDSGFGFYFIIGIIQYGLLISGITLPILVSIMLIRKREKTVA